MADFLVIRPGTTERPAAWVRVDSNGTQKTRVVTGPLEMAADDAANVPVIGLLPASEVLTTRASIPARSMSKIRAALPFALEESLADDIDNLHFAAGARSGDGSVPVAVIAKPDLERRLAEFREAGIEPARLVAENQGLAKVPGSMSILLDDRDAMFNDGADLEFAMQDVKPSEVLVAAGKLGIESGDDVDDGPEEQGHLLVFCDLQTEQRLQHDWIALRHELASVDVNVLAEGSLPKLAVTVAAGHGINLLQGSYGRAPEYTELMRPWKTAAALLIGFLALGGIGKGLDYFQLTRERDALQEQFGSEYRSIRPNDNRNIVDPVNTVRSLQRSVGVASAPPVFLQSLAVLSSAVAGNDGISIEQISYRAGVVDIRLLAPSIPELDAILQTVSDSGQFSAEIRSADQVGELIDGRLQIREAGS